MELNIRRYPIGIQNFEQLRNNDCVYVDKTELVYRLTHTDRVYFLSRRQEPACLHTRGLLPREERPFWWVGHGTFGEGLGDLSGAAH